MTRATVDLPVGYRIPIPRFRLDRENIARFHYVLHHMETGEDRPGKNIHTDYEFARGRGLPDVMADGSQTVAEISRVLTQFFGEGFLRDGRLVTKFIKPVYPDYTLDITLTITERKQVGHAVRYDMDISCANQHGLLVIVGRATAWAR